MKVLLTGGTGFVGSTLLKLLRTIPQYHVLSVVRSANDLGDSISNTIAIGNNIDGDTDYSPVLDEVDVIVHLAAMSHILKKKATDSEQYRRINVEGTLNLARQAAAAGVKRFIFISSVGVHGENSSVPFKESDALFPYNEFTISKYKAEIGLKEISSLTGMDVVVIRPPLVYGASAPANFKGLLSLVIRPIPLPFGCVNNRRSMIYVENLVDFIALCIEHPAAANQVFLVSDGEDISLSKLVSTIRVSVGQSPRLLLVPVWFIKLVAFLMRKGFVIDRLVGDLQVDSSKARLRLEWVPPFTLEQGLEATANDYRNRS